MDIFCPICNEPWDISCLHDTNLPYAQAKADFFARGCKALGSTCSTTRWPATGIDLHELYAEFGDDLDGLAGDLEDIFGG